MKRVRTGMGQQLSEAVAFKAMEKPVTNRFPKTPEIVKDNLNRWIEFFLSCSAEVAPIEYGQIGVGLKARDREKAVLAQWPERVPKRRQWGGDEGERKIAHDSVERALDEWQRRVPVGADPTGEKQRGNGQCLRERSAEFANEDVETPLGGFQGLDGLSESDIAQGNAGRAAPVRRPIGLIGQYRAGEVALTTSEVEGRHARLQGHGPTIDFLQQGPIVVQISQLR